MNTDSPFERGQIGGQTLTLENLKRILRGMEAIQPIDRSQAFETYFDEVRQRIQRLEND